MLTSDAGVPAGLPYIGGEEIERLLPMGDAVAVLREAFRTFDPDTLILRGAHSVPAGHFLTMPALNADHVGIKLVGVAPGNSSRGISTVQAVYVLFDAATLAPLVTMQGDTLTDIRTPAVSALATDLAARKDAHHLVVVGSGTQARGHVVSMLAVRPIERLSIVSRNATTSAGLADFARSLGIGDVRVAGREVLAEADIICTCTTSSDPVVSGADVPDGCHINAVGAFNASMCELDGAAMARGRILVEDRRSALAEAGDIIKAVKSGHIGAEPVAADLRDAVLAGGFRQDDSEVTIFKSVGIAPEDLAVAAEIYRRYRRNAGAA